MACSNQIFLETKWLYHYTADWARLEAGLDRLEESLGNLDQAFAAEQSPEDGSWGPCHEEWFHKAEATFLGAHDLMERGQEPKYPISLFVQGLFLTNNLSYAPGSFSNMLVL